MSAPAAEQTPRLVRALGFAAAASIIICNVIGQGVFIKARVMTCNVGSPILVLAAWVAAGLLALCGALTFAELGAMMPESGGPYAFLRRAFGRASAFAFGWTTFFAIGPATVAALAAAGAIYVNLLSGRALEQAGVRFDALGLHGAISGPQLVALGVIAVLTLINCAPVAATGAIATIFSPVKILLVGATALALFVFAHGSWSHYAMSAAAAACPDVAAAARGGLAGFGAAMIGALYAYNSWQTITYVAGELKDPGRTLPRAIVSAGIAVIGLYVAANAAYFYALTPTAVANVAPSSSVGVESVAAAVGSSWRTVVTALVLVSVVATIHVVLLTYSRITYALARDGVFFPLLARLSRGGHVPVWSVVALGVLASALVLTGSFDALSDYLIFMLWIFFALTGIAMIVLRHREPNAPRPYRTWGYPVVPVVFVAVAVWLLAEAILAAPLRSLGGLGVILAGLIVFWYRSRSIEERRQP